MAIKGYKGYDKDMKCRDFQYELGGAYEEKRAIACQAGFHFFENPLDVFNYYPPGQSRYSDVSGDGETDKHNEDSKVACTKISIGAELQLSGMIQAGVKFIFDRSNKESITTKDREFAATTGNYANAATTGNYANAATTGECANAATTGYRANAATTGYRANAATTGNYANAATTGNYANAATTGNYANAATTGECANAATTGNYANAATTGECANAATTGECANAAATGKHAIAAGIGLFNKAKAAIDNWIVLAEWVDVGDHYEVKTVKTVKVDGVNIKADTWYKLEGGKFVECDA